MSFRHFLISGLLLAVAGCGGGSNAKVSGKVTLNGAPLAKGNISFVPLDEKGGTAGGEILAGAYLVGKLKPAKYEVQITGIPEGPIIMPGSPEAERTRTEEEIRAGMDPLPADTTGNNQTFEVKAGAQTHDVKLESKTGAGT